MGILNIALCLMKKCLALLGILNIALSYAVMPGFNGHFEYCSLLYNLMSGNRHFENCPLPYKVIPGFDGHFEYCPLLYEVIPAMIWPNLNKHQPHR